MKTMPIFALVVLTGLGLLRSLIIADCTVRDPLVGIGYNLIYGNPDGDDDLAGRDPGLKYNYQILDITYTNGASTIIKSVEYCVPDQANTVPLTSCSYDEETYLFAGTASYQDIFSSMVAVDADYGRLYILDYSSNVFMLGFNLHLDNGLSSYEFSLSNGEIEHSMYIVIKETKIYPIIQLINIFCTPQYQVQRNSII